MINAVPFSKCDHSNLGVSDLCNLYDEIILQPTKYGDQVSFCIFAQFLCNAYSLKLWNDENG